MERFRELNFKGLKKILYFILRLHCLHLVFLYLCVGTSVTWPKAVFSEILI